MKIVKLDSLLGTAWSHTYNLANLDDESHGVVVDPSYNVYITGFVTTSDGARNFMTIKYNSSGTLQWSKQEAANNGSDLNAEATDIAREDFGDIYVTGKVDNGANLDFMTIIYNASGDRKWIETWDGGNNGDDYPYFVNADVDNQFYVGGRSYDGNNYTYTLVRYKKANYIMPPDDDVTKPSSLTFFENKGQIIDTNDSIRNDIKYYTTRQYPALYFTDDTLSYVFSRIDTNTNTDDTLARVGMSFYGSSTTKEIHHAESQGGEYLNFFLAHTGEKGITNVRHFDKLYEANVYPNVDVMYYFDNAGLKYYLIINPGWNSQTYPIKLQYAGATTLTTLTGNRLQIGTAIGSIIQKSADAYQISATGTLTSLAWDATYTITSGKVGFTLGTYDNTKILVIEIKLNDSTGVDDDDEVDWGTLYGSSYNDIITDVTSDHENNIIVCGITVAGLFPEELNYIYDYDGTQNDIFVQKFDAAKVPQWGILEGGTNRDGDDGFGGYYTDPSIAINSKNEIYVCGSSESDDFPYIEYSDESFHKSFDFYSGDRQGFINRINTSGDILWSTSVGTPKLDGLNGIVVNQNDDIIVAGYTSSIFDFDIFDSDDGSTSDYYKADLGFGALYAFDDNAFQLWGTKFGGNSDAGFFNSVERITDISLDKDDNILITGFTNKDESIFPITAGAFQETYGGGGVDGFVAKFNSHFDNLWTTFLGGPGNEFPASITVDNSNNVYIAGYQGPSGGSTSLPTFTNYMVTGKLFQADFQGSISDGFLAKYDEDGAGQLLTYFGGPFVDYLTDVVSIDDNIFLLGHSTSLFDDMDQILPLELTGFYFNGTNPSIGYAGILASIDQDTKLKLFTFIGDDAFTQGWALSSYENKIIIAGSAQPYLEYINFKPLHEFTGGYYQPTFNNPPGINRDGFIIEETDPDGISITEDILSNSEIIIYPNPSPNLINISNPLLENIIKIEIFNASAEKIIELNPFTNYTNTINIQSLASGLYTARVSTDKNVYNEKFIKCR